MKKRVTLLMISLIVFLLCSCNKNNDSSSNYLNGKGTIKGVEVLNGLGALYDDEAKYFNFESRLLLKLSKNNKVSINCDDPTCLHDTPDCKAYINGEYFTFNNKLYTYENVRTIVKDVVQSKGFIYSCEENQKKVVFDNPIPEDISEEKAEEDNTSILSVRNLENGILLVHGSKHTYLLDDKFEPIYSYDDQDDFYWGLFYNNSYYYVNDLYQLTKVNMQTKEKEIVELGCKVVAHDNEGDYFYYTDEYKDLYKYSLKDATKERLAEYVGLFSIYDGYIYYSDYEEMQQIKQFIIDTEGNLICDYTDHPNMGTDSIIKIDGKMYSAFKGGIAQMNPDGTQYVEYTMN